MFRTIVLLVSFSAMAQPAAPSPEYLESVERIKGKLLRSDKLLGAAQLKLERTYDPRIAFYVGVHGKPEILYVLDRWRVRLLYLREDRMVTFTRKSEEREAEVKGLKPIPPRFLRRLDEDERLLVLAVRAAQNPPPPEESRLGSCFAVSADGLVLTAAHTVGNAKRVRLRWADGRSEQALIERRLPKRDVALLRVQRKDLDPLPLATPGEAQMGDRVFSIGFPATRLLGAEPKFADGAISGEMVGESGRLLVTSVPTQAGNSGSPLINEAGQVVGMMVGAASHGAFLRLTGQRPQNVNFAVPVSDLKPLVRADPGAQSRDRRQAIERARAAICLIEALQP